MMARRREIETDDHHSLCVYIDADVADTAEIECGTLKGLLLGIQKFSRETGARVYLGAAGVDAFFLLPNKPQGIDVLTTAICAAATSKKGKEKNKIGLLPTKVTGSIPLVYVSANQGRMAAVMSRLPKGETFMMDVRNLGLDVHPVLSDECKPAGTSAGYVPLYK
jgi:hypothetical protein